MTRTELRVDVTAAAALDEELTLAASAFAPRSGSWNGRVLFCAPGGTYTRAYWDLRFPGHEGYSFAEYAVARGFSVVTFDHLGVGESSKPADGWALSTEVVARANDWLVRHVLAQFDERPIAIGIGHSMGGMLAVRQQGTCASYDAVAVLGFTTLYPMQIPFDQEPLLGLREQDLVADRASLGDPYPTFAREPMHELFHLPDVPPDIVALDDAAATNGPGLAGPACIVPGIIAEDAARIGVPLFLGFAERDTSRDPRLEPASYPACSDITLHVLEGSAHCTNLGRTRAQQWQRLTAWAGTVGSARTHEHR
jgi:pimeloyl-ACP methyl ester carboxylesterase